MTHTHTQGTTTCTTGLFTPPDRDANPRGQPVSLEPASAYEAVTRQMVVALEDDLREIKTRLNGLLFMVAGSLLLDVALRLATGR